MHRARSCTDTAAGHSGGTAAGGGGRRWRPVPPLQASIRQIRILVLTEPTGSKPVRGWRCLLPRGTLPRGWVAHKLEQEAEEARRKAEAERKEREAKHAVEAEERRGRGPVT